jgi:hypothetical protein
MVLIVEEPGSTALGRNAELLGQIQGDIDVETEGHGECVKARS